MQNTVLQIDVIGNSIGARELERTTPLNSQSASTAICGSELDDPLDTECARTEEAHVTIAAGTNEDVGVLAR